MSTEYDVSRATGRCAATDRPIAEGEPYYACLVEQGEELARKDYTLDAWTGPPEGVFCFWKARMPIKEKKPLVVDTNLLAMLFARLEGEDTPRKQQFRFVLALLLMRKRLLKFDQTVEADGQEYWQLRMVSDQSEHRVLNPKLSDQETALLSAQLTALLNGEVESLDFLDAEPAEQVEDADPAATADAGNEPDNADETAYA